MKYYIRINTHKPIVLRFWVESDVNILYGWVQVSLVFVLPIETPSINLTSDIRVKMVNVYKENTNEKLGLLNKNWT